MVPGDVAAQVTAAVGIPTIGIGAGVECDGQVLVWQDAFGLRTGRMAKFVKQYADLHGSPARGGPRLRRRRQGRHVPGARAHVLTPRPRAAGAVRCSRMRALSVTLLLSLLALATPGRPRPRRRPTGSPRRPGHPLRRARGRCPRCRYDRQVRGLSHPWDVQSIGHGRILVTERDTARLLTWHRGTTPPGALPEQSGVGVRRDRPDVARRRPGLLERTGGSTPARAATAAAAGTTYGSSPGGSTPTATRAPVEGTLLGGFPATSGRHGGCRLLITAQRRAARRHRRRGARHGNPREPALARRQGAAAEPLHRRSVARPTRSSTRPTATSATSSPTGTATCRASASAPTARSGRSSTAPTATTRSTCSSPVATTATTRSPATTRTCR